MNNAIKELNENLITSISEINYAVKYEHTDLSKAEKKHLKKVRKGLLKLYREHAKFVEELLSEK